MTVTDTTDDDILAVHPDGRASRYGSRTTTRVPAGFDPDDIAGIDAKILAFREAEPNGRIATDHERIVDDFGVVSYTVTAAVWRDGDERDKPSQTARSSRTYGVGEEPYCYSPLEWAESRAISRALRFLGYTADRRNDDPGNP